MDAFFVGVVVEVVVEVVAVVAVPPPRCSNLHYLIHV